MYVRTRMRQERVGMHGCCDVATSGLVAMVCIV